METIMKPMLLMLACVSTVLVTPASSSAQVVTSYFAPGPALTVPQSAVVGVAPSPVIGTIPVRTGLFGLRTQNIPVFAGASTTALPATALTSTANTFSAARPVLSPAFAGNPYAAFSSGSFAPQVAPAPLPNAVIQSGFRGTGPIYTSGFAPTAPITVMPTQINAFYPTNTFFPGAVMTMQ